MSTCDCRVLTPELPRVDQHHEPDSTTCTTAGCGCTLKRIGEDVSEKLDYTPGVFTVERHIRSKWACAKCQSLTQYCSVRRILHTNNCLTLYIQRLIAFPRWIVTGSSFDHPRVSFAA